MLTASISRFDMKLDGRIVSDNPFAARHRIVIITQVVK
jgi:hypothetical protein